MEIHDIDLSAANGDLLEEMKPGNKYLAEHPLEQPPQSYRKNAGGENYRIDLLFFHRSLHCLVAMELKVGK